MEACCCLSLLARGQHKHTLVFSREEELRGKTSGYDINGQGSVAGRPAAADVAGSTNVPETAPPSNG